MRVAVVAEYYPRPSHPGLGIWAHRQAQAVRELGVDVRVLVLERPLPPLRSLRSPSLLREWAKAARPRDTVLDGIPVHYVRYVSPPRPLGYASWGRWAARPLRRALDELRTGWEFDLVHAHYAVPAGDAALRSLTTPLVVSVHGGDIFYTAARSERGRRVVSRVFGTADAILANSELTRRGVEELGAPPEHVRVVHPGTDPIDPVERDPRTTLVTVGNLEQHKGQEDVVRALAALRERYPELRYVMVGGGPDRAALERLAQSLGVADRVSFTGAVSHERAMGELARAHVHVMPSRIDAFGVAHVEAMAAGLPTIGGAGTGAEEIEGAFVVRPGDVGELVRVLDELLGDERRRQQIGDAARRTVAEHFSWQRNGKQTVAVYEEVVRGG